MAAGTKPSEVATVSPATVGRQPQGAVPGVGTTSVSGPGTSAVSGASVSGASRESVTTNRGLVPSSYKPRSLAMMTFMISLDPP